MVLSQANNSPSTLEFTNDNYHESPDRRHHLDMHNTSSYDLSIPAFEGEKFPKLSHTPWLTTLSFLVPFRLALPSTAPPFWPYLTFNTIQHAIHIKFRHVHIISRKVALTPKAPDDY